MGNKKYNQFLELKPKMNILENFKFFSSKVLVDKKIKIYLFLDYDGTLAPITNNINKAFLPLKTKNVLEKINKNSKIELAIVSGRSVDDLNKFIGIKNIIFAGNHGFKIVKNDKPLHIVGENTANLMAKIKTKIKNEFANSIDDINDIVLEDKEFSIAIHYRLVKNKSIKSKLEEILLKTISENGGDKLKLKHGKKVFEIMPNIEWDKGYAVQWILNKMVKQNNKDNNKENNKENDEENDEENDGTKGMKNKSIVVYIGDDKTDEDAFKIVNKMVDFEGFSVLVKPGLFDKDFKDDVSEAKYVLNGVKEVGQFLDNLSELIG